MALARHDQQFFDAEPDLERLHAACARLRTDAAAGLQQLKWLGSQGSVMSTLYIGEAYARHGGRA